MTTDTDNPSDSAFDRREAEAEALEGDWEQLAAAQKIITAPAYLDAAINWASRIKPGGRATASQMTARRSALWMICEEIQPPSARALRA